MPGAEFEKIVKDAMDRANEFGISFEMYALDEPKAEDAKTRKAQDRALEWLSQQLPATRDVIRKVAVCKRQSLSFSA